MYQAVVAQNVMDRIPFASKNNDFTYQVTTISSFVCVVQLGRHVSAQHSEMHPQATHSMGQLPLGHAQVT
jgi:hypothetical protein